LRRLATETQRDKGTRRQGDKERKYQLLNFSLSPLLLVSLSLSVSLWLCGYLYGRAFDPPIELMNLTTDRFELLVVVSGEGFIALLLQIPDL
jgi:hypothetical protein